MARFSAPNLKNYTSHLNRGALLIIGAIAIIGLVALTYFYGEQNSQTATQPEQTTTQEGEAAVSNNENAVEFGDEEASGTTSEGAASTETDGEGRESSGDAATAPEELANTGPVLNYFLITVALTSLAYLYRHSVHNLEKAFQAK
ncbi:MAG: hypothetical protein WDZ81_00640 [Candidatus Saccharimonadales bacterium]